MKKNPEHLTWLDIDIKALKNNIRALSKRLSKGVKTMAVIKGNAYGHGMLLVAQIIENSVDYLAVFDFTDALELRKSGIKNNIVVLCPAHVSWVPEAIAKNIELVATSKYFLLQIEKLFPLKMKKLKIHLNIETGLGRDGFIVDEMQYVVKMLSVAKRISVVGLMTHFSGAESRIFDEYTKQQVEKLLSWKKALNNIDVYPMIHASGTAGSILDHTYQLDMVRFGIGLYGLWPSPETQELDKNLILKPALSLKTKIIEIKKLKKGNPIAYDQTHILARDSVIAVLPVGYFDGLPRSASDKGYMIVRGKTVRQIGRIMMNLCVLDITNIVGVKVGDTVTIIGSDSKTAVSTDDWAYWADTINYEIVTCINPSLPRLAK